MKLASRTVRAVERALVVDEMVSFVRHGIRNQLSSIRNATYYLERRARGTEYYESDERIGSFFQLIAEEVQKGERSLNATIDPQKRAREAVLLGEALAFVLELAPLPTGVRLEPDLDADVGVLASPAELAVLLMHLLENASDAVEGSGAVRVTSAVDGDAVVLVVTDEGGGFAAPDRGFELFYTTKPEHLGIGLNLVQRIARRCDGSASIANDGGGRVEVRLAAFRVRGENAAIASVGR